MCPVIWDIQNNQIHRDKLYITGYQGLGKGKREHTVYWTQNFSWEDENYGDGWWWFYGDGYTTNMHVLQFSSVAQSCPTLCDPMDCCMPDFPVHHRLLELTQSHVH